MSKNAIIISDEGFNQRLLSIWIVKPSDEDRVLFSSRESRLLILVKTDYYYICARLTYSRKDVDHFLVHFFFPGDYLNTVVVGSFTIGRS